MLKDLSSRKRSPGDEPARGPGPFVCFLMGMACMGLMQVFLPNFPNFAFKAGGQEVAARASAAPAPRGPQKPWGDFEYIKLLEEPREFMPSTASPLGAPHWFFGMESRNKIVGLIQTCGLTESQETALLDAHCWEVVSNGFYLSPPPEVVLEMSRPARERIYGVLSEYPANSAQCHPFCFRRDGFDEWFADTGLGQEQLGLLRKLVYYQGGSLCFADGAIVQGIFCAHDFNRLVKALYAERTFLMKLRINSQTDIDAVEKYWARGGNVRALRPLIESLARVPGGGSLNVGGFLPEFARNRLYTYANPKKDPVAPLENCLWTAMNFFNETPDNRFLDSHYVQQTLASEYKEVTTNPPVFGDLLAVRDKSGNLIHLCVYLADDVVFTKNGRDSIEPWVLMKVPDMLACYPPGSLTVLRNSD